MGWCHIYIYIQLCSITVLSLWRSQSEGGDRECEEWKWELDGENGSTLSHTPFCQLTWQPTISSAINEMIAFQFIYHFIAQSIFIYSAQGRLTIRLGAALAGAEFQEQENEMPLQEVNFQAMVSEMMHSDWEAAKLKTKPKAIRPLSGICIKTWASEFVGHF